MRMNGDFAFKRRSNFVGDGCMIEIRSGPKIHKELATVGYLVTSESACDLRYLCAGCTQTFMRVKFHYGQARNIARGLVYRVLAQMGMGRV